MAVTVRAWSKDALRQSFHPLTPAVCSFLRKYKLISMRIPHPSLPYFQQFSACGCHGLYIDHFWSLNGLYFLAKVVSKWYLIETKWTLDTWYEPCVCFKLEEGDGRHVYVVFSTE